MNKNLKNRENVSALADGHLQGADFIAAVNATGVDPDARAAWHVYHVVGDVLRSGEEAQTCAHTAHTEFMLHFQARLKVEAPLPRGNLVKHAPNTVVAHPPVAVSYGEAANASVFRWKMVAGFASVAAIVALSWTLMSGVNGTGAGAGETLALTPASATLATVNPLGAVEPNPPLVMIRDAHLDDLLAAHKQFGGTSALQAPAGFLRNATFEVSGR